MGLFDFFEDPDPIANVSSPKLNLGNASDIYGKYLDQQQYGQQLQDFNNYINSLYQGGLSKNAPGLLGGISNASKNAEALTRGELPKDVEDAINRSAAARSYGTGVGVGSGMGRNLVARDLGLTSLDLQGQGLSQLGNILGLTQSINPMNIQSQLFTPQQLLQRSDQEKMQNWQVDLQDAQTNAMINQYNSQQESPFDSMLGNLVGGLTSAIPTALTSFATGGASLGASSLLGGLFGGGGTKGGYDYMTPEGAGVRYAQPVNPPTQQPSWYLGGSTGGWDNNFYKTASPYA